MVKPNTVPAKEQVRKERLKRWREENRYIDLDDTNNKKLSDYTDSDE